MKIRLASSMVLIAAIFVRPSSALADGGTLQLSQRVGKYQISVFTSPAAPRVGPIDVSVLVQDADTGNIDSSVPINIAMENIDAPAIPLVEPVATASATNKLFQSATFEVPQAGTWRVKVNIAESTSNGIQFDLAVSPPLPPWLTLTPWIAWPMVVIAGFLIHQRLKIWHSRRQAGRISGTFATMRTELRGPNWLILDAAARHD